MEPGATLVEVQDSVGPKVEGFFHAMLDDDDRIAVVREVAEDREQSRGGRRVEVGEWLINHVQPGLHHQDPGDGDELALPAGQGTRLAADQGLDARACCDVAEPRAHLVARRPEVLRPEGHLGLDGRADDLLARVLEHGPDGPCDVAQLQLGGRLTGDPDDALQLARIGVRDEPVDRPDERALAAARRAGDQDDLTRVDRQRHVADRRLGRPSIPEGEAVDRNQRFGAGCCHSPTASMRTGVSISRPKRSAAEPWLIATARPP